MAPTLVFDADNRLHAVVGSPGGSQIITYVTKTLVGILDWKLDPQVAVDLPNFGSRNGPTEIEAGTEAETWKSALEAKGHQVRADRDELRHSGHRRRPERPHGRRGQSPRGRRDRQLIELDSHPVKALPRSGTQEYHSACWEHSATGGSQSLESWPHWSLSAPAPCKARFLSCVRLMRSGSVRRGIPITPAREPACLRWFGSLAL